jgi:predicted Zn-dependent protease
MSTRAVLLSMAGLGLLAAPCGGMRMPSLPRDAQSAVELVETASDTYQDNSRCNKLNADIAIAEEYALGGSVAINWVQRGGGLMLAGSGEPLHQYINVVGKNLAAQSPRPTLSWTFGVLEDPQAFDAVSAPGGYVFVTRRLLQGVENEAQLAGVLAHEIAHITGKHALARYGQVKVGQCKTAMGIKAGKKLGGQLGADFTPASVDALLATLKEGSGGFLDLDKQPELLTKLTDEAVDSIVENGFGKEDEYAADELALRLMASAGYDPQEFIRFLGKLPDSGGVYSNHPSRADRVNRLKKLLEAAKTSREDFPELPASTSGLARPPLPASFSGVKGSAAGGKP